MTQDELKQAVARAALEYVVPDAVLGVGSGSTVNLFIEALAASGLQIAGAIASSQRTADRLSAHRIPVLDLNTIETLPVYIDGADEVTPALAMIKGGGGALTREKVVAAVARQFVCIADASKLVDVLGRFPLPVEVIPMARAYVARKLVKLGGRPVERAGFTTDNGNVILDTHALPIHDPVAMETTINQIVGVVTVGLFARRGADVLLLASADGVRKLTRA